MATNSTSSTSSGSLQASDAHRQGNASANARRSVPAKKPQPKSQQGLKIIPYNPDPAKRKATRRRLAAQEAAQGPSEETAESIAEHNAKQTELLRKVDRIPSTRSWDPFNALAVLYVSKEERFILNYAYTRSWKVWEDPVSGTNNFAQAWMWRSMESPAAFYAQIVGAASHYQICRRETPISSEKLATVRLQAKAKAIEKLRSEIDQYHRKASSIPFDSLLMAVFCLAVHDNVDIREKEEPHPISALAKLRDMQIYGRVVFGNDHMKALYQLIEQKGGLGSIDENAFGPVMPLLDVIYAVRTQQKPKFACTKTLKSIQHPSIWLPDEKATILLESLGSAFRNDNLAFGLDEELQTTLLVVAEMTAGLDHFERCGVKPFKNILVLLDNTDWAAHRMVSMPAFEVEEDQEFQEHIWNEICRLTALLYIDIVVFPTPPQAGVKDTLSSLLLPRLSEIAEFDYWRESNALVDLLLWAALIGAIAAGGTALERSFTYFIAEIFQTELTKEWESIQGRLQNFLWVSNVCDSRAKEVWEMACRGGTQVSLETPDSEESITPVT